MGIDVMFCEQIEGEWRPDDQTERVTNVDGVLVTAYMFGMMLEPIREMARNPPAEIETELPITEAVGRFEDYLTEHGAKGIAAFRKYYEDLKRTAAQIKAKGLKHMLNPPVVEQLPLEEIEKDAQAFFGWFMLTERVIGPEEAAVVGPILGAARGLSSAYAEIYRDERSDLARMMAHAYEILDIPAQYCDRACDEGRHFCFSF